MDLNALYQEHQLSLMRAHAASGGLGHNRHQAAAATIARRIGHFQSKAGAGAAGGWLAAGSAS